MLLQMRTLAHEIKKGKCFIMQTLNSINTKEDSINLLKETKNKLAELISSFDNRSFNEVPFAESWTASQVADHIRKSVKGIPSVLGGNSTVGNRKPDEKFKLIRRVFLDFDAKYKAPEFIVPPLAYHDVAEMRDRISQAFDAIENKSAGIDMSLIYGDFELPMMGTFTGFEWIEFVCCHTMRHIRQIENIKARLKS
jgi:hypothetical protein